MIQTALISVYDKQGLDELAPALAAHGVRIISTGSTAEHLTQLGIEVTEVSEVTGFPEMLSGRVKSLHPHIHGAILARREEASDREAIKTLGVDLIDLVVVNLYPFADVAADDRSTHGDIIEMIDIGGPALIRAAAKNHRDVVVVVDPSRYGDIVDRLQSDEPFDVSFREALALEAFASTAVYDAHIQQYFMDRTGAFPEHFALGFARGTPLRYGENPHQRSVFYHERHFEGTSVSQGRQLHGRALSYNNIMDAAAALQIVQAFDGPTAVGIKHANPCGLATASTLSEAFRRVVAADPVSIFGGIVACNRLIDGPTAAVMAEIFLEVVVAPGFSSEALDILTRKKNVRLLDVGAVSPARPYLDLRRIPGGLLVQEADVSEGRQFGDLTVVTEQHPTADQRQDLMFAWNAVQYVKSNAITVAKNQTLIGVGAGQMNRIQSARLALEQAEDDARGGVLASDAFFPFPDVVQTAARAGISAIIQPGGSKRDQESIDAANEAGIAMVFTGRRHFRH